MTDPIREIQKKADVIRATVFTRRFRLEGMLHCPRVGKGKRLLSNLLNSPEKRFVALTNATLFHLGGHETPDPRVYSMLQVNMNAIEFIVVPGISDPEIAKTE